jgi:hypothetical protein
VVDHRADIYALGLVLHEILTGVVPAGPAQIATEQIFDARLIPVIARCLTPAPDDRFQGVEGLIQALRKVLQSSRSEIIKKDALTAVLVVMAFCVGGCFALAQWVPPASYILFCGVAIVRVSDWYYHRMDRLLIVAAYMVTLTSLVAPLLGWERAEQTRNYAAETVGILCGIGMMIYSWLTLWQTWSGSRNVKTAAAKASETVSDPQPQSVSTLGWVVRIVMLIGGFIGVPLLGVLALVSNWADWTTLNKWLPIVMLTIILMGEFAGYYRRTRSA